MSFGQIGKPAPYTGPEGAPDTLASRIMSAKDYAVLTRRTQMQGGLIGLLTGAGVTFAASRLIRPRPSGNVLFLTFFSSATIGIIASTHVLLTQTVKGVREQTPAAVLQKRKLDSEIQVKKELEGLKAADEKEFEAGAGGWEDFKDTYATTRGDH